MGSVATVSAFGAEKEVSSYAETVRPLLAKYCFACHGSEKQKGKLRLDLLPHRAEVEDFDSETWRDALDQLNLGEMPPPEEKAQPSAEERKVLTDWADATLDHAASLKRRTAGRVLLRRLTREAYANTMRDLLGVDVDYAADLPPEPASPEGFRNNGAVLETTPTHLEAYLAAARKGLAEAIPGSSEAPETFRYEANETAVGKVPRKGAVPVNPEFLVDLPKFPRRGEFAITVKVGGVLPNEEGFPRLRVSLGTVAGIIHVPRKVVGEAEVTAPADEPQTLVFRGRMENFPQSGDRPFGNSPFVGVILIIDFLDADGKELRYADRAYSDPPAKPKKGAPPKPPLSKSPPGDRLDLRVHSVTYEAPVFATWPPASQTRLLPAAEEGEGETARARRALEPFLRKAFRRPSTEAETTQYVKLFAGFRAASDSFEEAMRETFAAVLTSPHFLYLVETRDPDKADSAPQTLTDHELAVRLSYFLTNSPPDATLVTLADQGKLVRPEVLAGQVNRLLDDARSASFLRNFTEQWLDLAALDRVAVNPEYYPDFDNALKDDMRREPVAVLTEILRRDRSLLELLDADWTMANRALATHYGLSEPPRTSRHVRVKLPAGHIRGGLLGQGAFLLGHSDGQFPHPIKRATWLLDRLLDSPPAPPPPDVPDLADASSASSDAPVLTVKERLALHREKEACANCHRGIDPWGLPLERFDAVGLLRENAPQPVAAGKGKRPTKPKPVPIDDVATLPNGQRLAGAAELKGYLLRERRDLFVRSIVKRLLSYALGRSLDLADRPTVEALQTTLVQENFRLRPLLLALAKSEAFLTK